MVRGYHLKWYVVMTAQTLLPLSGLSIPFLLFSFILFYPFFINMCSFLVMDSL